MRSNAVAIKFSHCLYVMFHLRYAKLAFTVIIGGLSKLSGCRHSHESFPFGIIQQLAQPELNWKAYRWVIRAICVSIGESDANGSSNSADGQ